MYPNKFLAKQFDEDLRSSDKRDAMFPWKLQFRKKIVNPEPPCGSQN